MLNINKNYTVFFQIYFTFWDKLVTEEASEGEIFSNPSPVAFFSTS